MTSSISTQHLALSDIHEPQGRIRPAYAHRVAEIAQSYRIHGQTQPIIVRTRQDGGYWLVDGLHRLMAAKTANLSTIRAEVHDLDEVGAEWVEIEANVNREDLTALDRALFLKKRKDVYERLYPETAHGKAKKSRKKHQEYQELGKEFNLNSFTERFSKFAEQRTGFSESTIKKACGLIKLLSPEVIDLLRRTPVASNTSQLKLLASQKNEDDRLHIARLIAEGEVTNVKAAMIELNLIQAPDAEAVQERKLFELLARAKPKVKRRVIELLFYDASIPEQVGYLETAYDKATPKAKATFDDKRSDRATAA